VGDKLMLALELCAIFLGVLARVFFPWVRKLRSGKAGHFSKRYLYSAIGSVMGDGAEGAVRLFAMAFGFGFGWHAIVDEVAKWAGAFKDGEKEK